MRVMAKKSNCCGAPPRLVCTTYRGRLVYACVCDKCGDTPVRPSYVAETEKRAYQLWNKRVLLEAE